MDEEADRLAAVRQQGERLQRAQAVVWAVSGGLAGTAAGAGLLLAAGLRLGTASPVLWVLGGLLGLALGAAGAVLGWRHGQRTPAWQSGVCCRNR